MEDRASQEDIIPEKADEDDKQQEGDPDEEGDDDKQQEDPCVWKFICYHRPDKEGDWYCGVCDSAVEGFAKARQKWPKMLPQGPGRRREGRHRERLKQYV